MSKKKRRRRSPQRPRPAPAGQVTLVRRPADGTGSGADGGTRAPPGVTPEGVVGLVATGAVDDQLAVLQAAIRRRWEDLHREASHVAAAQLRVGDRVRIAPGARPQYLQGATGTVTGWSGRSAVVQLDMPVGRYRTGELCCPPLALVPLGTRGN